MDAMLWCVSGGAEGGSSERQKIVFFSSSSQRGSFPFTAIGAGAEIFPPRAWPGQLFHDGAGGPLQEAG